MTTKECIACAELILEKAKLCRYCGTNQSEFVVKPAVHTRLDAPENTPNSDRVTQQQGDEVTAGLKTSSAARTKASFCPTCQSYDRVEKVSTVVSGGRSNSLGIAVGNVIGTSSVGLAGTLSASQTELSLRLQPPAPEPEKRTIWAVLVGVSAATLFVRNQMLGEVTSTDELASVALLGMSFLIAAIPGFLIGLVLAWIVNKALQQSESHQSAIQLWQTKSSQILGMYYCFRDDVVFDSKAHPQTPEEFYS